MFNINKIAILSSSLLIIILSSGCANQPKNFETAYKKASSSIIDPKSKKPVCPDESVAISGSSWTPSACQATIVQAAVNHCLVATNITNDEDYLVEYFTNDSAALAALGLGIGGIASATPPAWIAAAALFASSSGTNIAKAFSGTPATTPIASLYTAASQYAQYNQNIPLPKADTPIKEQFYYGGLWNAVGSACPPGVFWSDFKFQKLKYQD